MQTIEQKKLDNASSHSFSAALDQMTDLYSLFLDTWWCNIDLLPEVHRKQKSLRIYKDREVVDEII